MAKVLFSNFASTTLAGNISNAATSLSVAVGTGSKFPPISGGDWFPIVVVSSTQKEIMRCTARLGDVLTVTRGQEGTAAHAFTAGDIVDLRLTKAALEELKQQGDLPLPVADGGTGASTPGTARINLGLQINVAVQAFSNTLQALSGLVTTAFGRLFLTDASVAAFKTRVNLEEDVDYLKFATISKNLRDIAAPAANKIPYLTSATAWAYQAFTATDRLFLGAANVGEQRTALGLGDLATLDATDLVYAGSTVNNLDFPVFSMVHVNAGGASVQRNASATVRIGLNSNEFVIGGATSALLGTWRQRGQSGSAAGDTFYLFQRTA